MPRPSIHIHHNDPKRVVLESAREMVELVEKEKPFLFCSDIGAQIYDPNGIRDIAVMTQKLINEVNTMCLQQENMDFNQVVKEEFLKRHSMVPAQETPDNTRANEQAVRENAAKTKKVFPDDEGALEAAVFLKGDQVVISFGKSVKWLSLGKAEAQAMIDTLQKKVDAL